MTSPAAPPRRPIAALVGVGVAAAAVAVWVQAIARGGFVWMIWSDRDLVRADVPLLELPTVGAELSSGLGARIPGGLHELLLWVPLRLTGDPAMVWRAQAACALVAGLVLARDARRRWGVLPAAVSAATFLGSDLVTSTVSRLWNPGWLPLPLACAWVAWLRLRVDGRARAVVPLAAALAVAMQLHLSTGLLAVALAVATLPRAPEGTARHLRAALVVAVALYLPHLLDELAHGAPNTRALLDGRQTASLGTGVVGPHAARTAAGLWSLVGSDDVLGRAAWRASLPRPPAGLGAAVLLLVACVLGRPGATDRARALVARGALLVCAVALVSYARSRDLVVAGNEGARYAVILAPALATLAGAGVAALLEARAVVRALGATAVAVLSLALVAGAQAELSANAAHVTSWGRLRGLLDDAAAATGAPLGALAGRLVVARPDAENDGWDATVPVPVDFLLQRERASFAGSSPGPCHAVFVPMQRGGAAPPTPDLTGLRDVLGAGLTPVEITSTTDTPSGAVVTFRTEGRCPTSLTQRYLPTTEETEATDALASLAPGAARRVGDDVWVARLAPRDGPRDTGSPVLVRIARRGDTWTVWSNQLRGYAYNTGVLGNAAVERFTLRAHHAAGDTLFPLAVQRVGWTGESTPIRVDAPALVGAQWSVEGELLPEAETRGWDGIARRRVAFSVTLPTE